MPALAGPRQSYQQLARRNGRVAMLRLAVPLLGALVLGGLMAQIYLASLTGRFDIAHLTVTPDAVSIDAPVYVGTLSDGSSYRVWAERARAASTQSELIDLTDAHLVVNRIDGVQLTMEAAEAQLDTAKQLTLVPGLADVADSTGTTGTLRDSVFDWQAQLLTTRGPVAIDYADGSTVRAQGLVYDAAAVDWTFERSVVTLPSTPGEGAPGAIGDETQ